MKKFLGTIPLYVLLIPLFFVLHGYVENFGYIDAGQTLLLAAIYSVGAAITFLLCLLVYRNCARAALATAFFLCTYFFFGALQDFLKEHAHSLSRYAVLLPALMLTAILLLIGLKRTKRSFPGWQLFLNCLFLLYIVIDLAGMLARSLQKNRDPAQTLRQEKMGYVPCPTTTRPDIYFLVFDAYASSKALKEQYHFDNSAFDHFLEKEGFHIQQQSRSNYRFTFFSMPSILNMSYLEDLEIKRSPVELRNYLTGLILDNEVMAFLHRQGYEIVNCSSFDLRGNPSPVVESLLPIRTRLITAQTLYSRVIRDLGYHFLSYLTVPVLGTELYQSLNNDNKLIAAVEKASALPAGKPRFIYGHFNFPHPPYYYGKLGVKRTVTSFYDGTDENNVQGYLDYLYYTNLQAEHLVTKIKKNSGGKAVIILMGDHGLRYPYFASPAPLYQLENQNAVYFPGKDYHLLYDSISGVNQFRVVLNTLFGQHLPLLKDSSAELK
jgi:hypothetical protein